MKKWPKIRCPDSPLVSLGKVPDMIMQLKTGKVDAVLMDKDTAEAIWRKMTTWPRHPLRCFTKKAPALWQ